MHADVIDPETLIALEPDELALRLLPVLSNTREPLTLRGFLDSSGHMTAYKTAAVRTAIREAWAWLEGSALLIPTDRYTGGNALHPYRTVSRKGVQLAQTPDPLRSFSARRLPKEHLHQRIREDVWAYFHRGKFDTAIFEAMKAVEVATRGAVGNAVPRNVVGIKLMRAAFHPETGPLRDLTMDSAEQQARADMFAGAIGSFKNARSHRDVDLDDPNIAAEIIMFANLLLRTLDGCTRSEGK